MKVEILMDKEVDLKDHILIEGFPGIGLVGTIAAGYIIEKRDMKPIGHILSDRFPPMTTIHEGRPFFPARIYKDPNAKFCVLLSEFVIPSITVSELSKKILEFSKNNGIKKIISLAGMTSAKKEISSPKVFAIVSNQEMEDYLKSKNVEIIKEGITTGVSGVLIARCSIKNFPAASLLVESKHGYPDPSAAAALINSLDSLLGLKVDTKDLLAEAKQVEEKMKKLLSQIKKTKRSYEKAETELPMYT